MVPGFSMPQGKQSSLFLKNNSMVPVFSMHRMYLSVPWLVSQSVLHQSRHLQKNVACLIEKHMQKPVQLSEAMVFVDADRE